MDVLWTLAFRKLSQIEESRMKNVGLLLLTFCCCAVSALPLGPEAADTPVFEVAPISPDGTPEDPFAGDDMGGMGGGKADVGGSDVPCNATLVTEEGEIMSERFSDDGKFGRYAPNLDCYWEIQAPEGKRVKLEFTIFVVQRHKSCRLDFVTLYDSDSQLSPNLGPTRMCGHRKTDPFYPTEAFVSSGRDMLLHFKTNSKVQQRGWKATVSFFEQ